MLTLLYVRLPYCCGGIWTDGQKITSTMPILQQWRGHTRVSFEKWARSVGGHIEPCLSASPTGPPTSTATSCLRCFVCRNNSSVIPDRSPDTSASRAVVAEQQDRHSQTEASRRERQLREQIRHVSPGMIERGTKCARSVAESALAEGGDAFTTLRSARAHLLTCGLVLRLLGGPLLAGHDTRRVSDGRRTIAMRRCRFPSGGLQTCQTVHPSGAKSEDRGVAPNRHPQA